MNITLDCISCLVRQTVESARFISDDPEFHEQILRETLSYAAGLSFKETPPVLGAHVHQRIRELTGVADPYKTVKDRFNQLARELLPALEEEVRTAADPFERALHLAIAGNVIDFGVRADIDEDYLYTAVEQAANQSVAGDIEEFKRQIDRAERILYLADNTGEIVFDRLLIDQLPRRRVTVAVRGAPIINDATMEDAEYAGITEIVPVISNGAAVPGTDLSSCSDRFRRVFDQADLIISKGQGNFETLNDVPGINIAFLFRVKCGVIATLSGYPEETHVLLGRFV